MTNHTRPADGYGCQVCGECTRDGIHTVHNCEHDPLRELAAPEVDPELVSAVVAELVRRLQVDT